MRKNLPTIVSHNSVLEMHAGAIATICAWRHAGARGEDPRELTRRAWSPAPRKRKIHSPIRLAKDTRRREIRCESLLLLLLLVPRLWRWRLARQDSGVGHW